MRLNRIYLEARRRLRKRVLSLLKLSYQNEKLDGLEAKLIALALKTLASSYLKVGVVIPDKVYDGIGTEVANTLDKINLKLQERLKDE